MIADNEPQLADYTLIGDSCSAALVSKYGSIDWCCIPDFDSPAIFAALLDKQKGGHFSIAPSGDFESRQRYVPDTNVLETIFHTSDGTFTLTDAFVAATEEMRRSTLMPDHEILRVAKGTSGVVTIKMEYAPRSFYGREVPQLEDRKKLGVRFSIKENSFTLLMTPGDSLNIDEHSGIITSEFRLHAGQTVIFSLSHCSLAPVIVPELSATAPGRMEATITYWKDWIGKCRYQGVYLDAVKRSALTLKLLEHAPSGSIIAAPTTSLPEKLEGKRNWDYRFCWLRDASFTARVLVKLGFEDEVHAYMNWILHATRLSLPELQVVYSLYGDSRLAEKTLDWLDGYHGSRPVRIGNAAHAQFQLDVYGEVLDALYAYAPLVKDFDFTSRSFIIGLGTKVCRIWNLPDNGIWEIRSPNVHHTHSKVLAWVGLDRVIKLSQKYNWTNVPLKEFRRTANAIRDSVERYGFNSQLNSYTREFNGATLDASLLTLPLVEYCSYTSPRMLSTMKVIHERLSQDNLIYRYRNVDDGVGGDEGSFAICNFWLAENYAKSGKTEEAIEIFETMLRHASPAGLLAEQIDTRSHKMLGNYPQGFTHIGLINAAISINEVVHEKQPYEYS
jgi:GH15 family glucan-1,4-alpha-glucosidase